MLIDFDKIEALQRYFLMANTVVPRPIAWVLTEGEVLNIAPFSFFTPVSSEPATVMISIGHRDNGIPKDTLRNLRESKKCVICIVDEDHFASMHLSSKGLEPNQSELDAFDIPTQTVLDDFPPMPKGIKVALFGEYLQEVDLKGSKTIPVIVEVKHLYIDDVIISDTEKISLEFYAIARVGRSYRRLGDKLTAPEIV